jgi:hypothetical protein
VVVGLEGGLWWDKWVLEGHTDPIDGHSY